MAKRCTIPPDDIADWYNVSVAADLDRNSRSPTIVAWIEAEIAGRWYMRSNFVSVNGYDYLLKVFSFQNEEDRMWFAMRWA